MDRRKRNALAAVLCLGLALPQGGAGAQSLPPETTACAIAGYAISRIARARRCAQSLTRRQRSWTSGATPESQGSR